LSQSPPLINDYTTVFLSLLSNKSQQATAEDALPQSPYVGSKVTTTGIVTALDSNAMYLQDATGDGDDTTSDAIVVFTGSGFFDDNNVTVGDEVSVTGTVSEFGFGTGQTTTQIGSVEDFSVLNSGVPLPAPVLIGGSSGRKVPTTTMVDAINFFESLEAMLVTVVDPVAVAATNRFGEIFVVSRTDGLPDTGAPLSARGTLNIADGDFNPEKIQIDEDSGIFNFDFPNVNVGATLGDVTGVVGYSFGNYEIYPIEDFTSTIVDNVALEPVATTLSKSDDDLLIATYNVLNLDPNDSPDEESGDTDIADGRFAAIASHVVDLMGAPDIIALQEIQDSNGGDNDGDFAADLTLQTLVDAIEDAGGPVYNYIDNTFITDNASGGQPGGNIRTAYLYDPSRVSFDESTEGTISGQSEGEAFEGARLPLVATFTFNGQEVTIINVHFSSKGGSADITGSVQPFETRQEDVEVNGSLDERALQASAVQDYITRILDSNEDANIVVLGDFNEFEFVSPVESFTTVLGMKNLADDFDSSEVYTFEFQGNSQALDHILVSPSLISVAKSDFPRVNVEFPDSSSAGSDHDPVVATLTLPAAETSTPTVSPTSGSILSSTVFAFIASIGGYFLAW
jgi:predicted extracellular nuclease